MRYTLSVFVKNKHGVLARIAGLFSARGYNIVSLTVSETLDFSISYMTIVVEVEEKRILAQIKKQLNKLIDIVTIADFTKKEHIDRELVLVKINYTAKDKTRLKKVLNKYLAKIIKHRDDTVIIEVVDKQERIKQLIYDLRQFGIKELLRSGKIAMV